jgi:hypothetical protein
MNNYRIDRLINVWAPKFSASEKMQLVAKHAEQGKHKGKAKLEGTTYNQPEDTRISVQGYLNRIDP